MEQLINRFTKLVKDNHILNQTEDSMISAVNGTLINTEENQFIFQNLIGSLPAGTLKDGAKPLAVTKFRETLFIVSMYYRDGIAIGEIGTYPSPNWAALNDGNYNGEFLPVIDAYSPIKNFLNITDENDSRLYSDLAHTQDFATDKFNFKGNLIELHYQLSYDNSVNLILIDPNNPMKLINTRFILSEDGTTAKLAKRNQIKNTNTYSAALFSTTKLLKQPNIIPVLNFEGVINGGFFKGGGAKFYFRYTDTDGNVTDIIEESSLVVFAHDDKGANFSETTNKAVKFKLTNLDPQFTGVKVYYSFSGSAVAAVGDLVEINATYDYVYEGPNTELNIVIFGNEDTNLYDNAALNFDLTQLNSARTATQNDGSLLLANVKSLDDKLLMSLKRATSFVPIKEGVEAMTIATIDDDFTIKDGYADPLKVYSKVGYWDAETYELGVVYILTNGRGNSPVMPLRGIDNITGTATYTTTEIVADNGFLGTTSENNMGVYRTSRREDLLGPNTNPETGLYEAYVKYLTIDTNILGQQLALYNLENEIEGFFIVRKERRKDAICQGYLTNTAAFPAMPYLPAANLAVVWEYFSVVGPISRIALRDKNKTTQVIQLNSEMRAHLIDLSQGIGSRLYGKIDCKFVPAPGRVFTAALSSVSPIFKELYTTFLPNTDYNGPVKIVTASKPLKLNDRPANWLTVNEINLFFSKNVSGRHLIADIPANRRGYSVVGKVEPKVDSATKDLAVAFYTGDALVNEPYFNSTFNSLKTLGIEYSNKPVQMKLIFPKKEDVRIRNTTFINRTIVNVPVQDVKALGFQIVPTSLQSLIFEKLNLLKFDKIAYIIENQESYSKDSFAGRLSGSALFASRRYKNWNSGEYLYFQEKGRNGLVRLFTDPRTWFDEGKNWEDNKNLYDEELDELFRNDYPNYDILTLDNKSNKYLNTDNLPLLKPDGYYEELAGTRTSDGFVQLTWMKEPVEKGLTLGSATPRAASLAEDHLKYGSYIGLSIKLDNIPQTFVLALENKTLDTKTFSLVPHEGLGSSNNGNTVLRYRYNDYLTSKRAALKEFTDPKHHSMGIYATIYPQIEGALTPDAWKALYQNTNFNTAYFAITPRYTLGQAPEQLNIFNGDAFISLVYKQVFTNTGIDGIITASNPETYRTGNKSGGLVNRSLFMPLIHVSNHNLSLRCDDYTFQDEVDILGGPRPANPVTTGFEAKNTKYQESKAYNFGYQYFIGRRAYAALNFRAPKFNTEFTNRVFVSSPNSPDSFNNAYRDFMGFNFQDYYPELGEIVRLITLNDYTYVIFEDGMGIVPLNAKTILPSSEGGLEVKNAEILSTEMVLMSNTIGSNQQFSIIATDRYLYGYHADTNSIWKAYQKGMVVISDYSVQKDLVAFNKVVDIDKETKVDKRVVVGSYNTLTKSVTFSFLNESKKIDATNWNKVRQPIKLGNLKEIDAISTLRVGQDLPLHVIQPEAYATVCYNQTMEVFEPNKTITPLFMDIVQNKVHSFIADYSTNIIARYDSEATHCNFLGQQHEFMFEYVVNKPVTVQKIVDNLMITSNKSYPDQIDYTIEKDFKQGLIEGGEDFSTKESIRVRYELLPLNQKSSYFLINNQVYFTGGKGYKHAKKLRKGYFRSVDNTTLKILGEIFIIDNKFYNLVLNEDGTPYTAASIDDILDFNPMLTFGITMENIQYENDHMYVSVGREGSLIRDKAIKIKLSYSGETYTTIHSIITKVSYT